jgi:hypothetical protein
MAQNSVGVMAQRPDPVQARIAPYTGKTSLFLTGGITLIAVNFLLTQQGWTIATALLPAAPRAPASATNTSLLGLAGQVVILGALLLVGSVSDEGATFALLFLAALWLGFFYHHRDLLSGLLSQATPGATSPASSSAAPGSTTPTSAWLQP